MSSKIYNDVINIISNSKNVPSKRYNTTLEEGSLSRVNSSVFSNILIENCIHASPEVFNIVNQYRGILQYTSATLNGPAGKEKSTATKKIIFDQVTTPSLFNPYYSIKAAGITPHVPVMDTQKHQDPLVAEKSGKDGAKLNSKLNLGIHTDDCSIANLVYLSKFPNSPLGQAKYKYSDFMFCRDVGKISNNHMITLRRFAAPVGDNIFYATQYVDEASNVETPGDIGRLITWFGTEENKLESILKYSYKAEWKEFKAKRQDLPSQETDKARGFLGGIVNLFNPRYGDAVAAGRAPSSLALILGSDASDAFYTEAPYENNPVVNGAMYDSNKIYAPQDTVRSTHQYDGNLVFSHEFTLTFNYKLRGYDNINAKTAFLDLLGNILAVTYRSGTFWPGEQRIIGAPPYTSGWNKAQKFSKGISNATGTFFNSMLAGKPFGAAGKDFISQIGNVFGNVLNIDFGNISKEGVMKALTNVGSKALGAFGGKELGGLMQNQMGRPSVYAFDSLLSNDVVGTWHVTIGNPLNPIISMGNLIIDNVELTHSGPLGLDDFPTELSVVISLKHAMPRDSVDIQRMYTQGRTAIYTKISNDKNIKIDSIAEATSDARKKEDKDAVNKAQEYLKQREKTNRVNETLYNDEKYTDKLKELKNAKDELEKLTNAAKPSNSKINAAKKNVEKLEKEIATMETKATAEVDKTFEKDYKPATFDDVSEAYQIVNNNITNNPTLETTLITDKNISAILSFGDINNKAKNEIIGWLGASEIAHVRKVLKSLK